MRLTKPTVSVSLLLGLFLAVSSVVIGLVLDKGSIGDLLQITAAVVVFGGTAGSTIISVPRCNLSSALRAATAIVFRRQLHIEEVSEDLATLLSVYRKVGRLALIQKRDSVKEPVYQRGLTLFLDDVDSGQVRDLLEKQCELIKEECERASDLFQTAAGYAPTLGIMGAVIGLIQVMKHLDDLGDVGRGISTAFVATIYGLGVANLVLLPLSTRIREQAALDLSCRRMIVDALMGLQIRTNHTLLQEDLNIYADPTKLFELLPKPAFPKTNFSDVHTLSA